MAERRLTVMDIKSGYVGCIREYFPTHTVHTSIYSPNGKTHKYFEELFRILSARNIDPRKFMVFTFSRCDRPPTPQSLLQAKFVEMYLQHVRVGNQ